MSKYLIVNADDYGMDESATIGILRSHLNGIVTAASMIPNLPTFERAIRLWRSVSTLDLGVHLNLLRGRPLMKPQAVRSLTTDSGEFMGRLDKLLFRLVTQQIRLMDVEKEWGAQIRRCYEAGVAPSHLDSEKHLHCWPALFGIALRLAETFKIPFIRIPAERSDLRLLFSVQGLKALGIKLLLKDARALVRRNDLSEACNFEGISLTRALSSDNLINLLAKLHDRTITELMVHPGDESSDVKNTPINSGFIRKVRDRQVKILTDSSLKGRLAALDVRLINFQEARILINERRSGERNSDAHS